MKKGKIDASVFIADGAKVMGDVTIGKDASVWYNAVIRADRAPIVIGQRSNIQDGAILHEDTDNPLILGDEVVVGHGAILHGCEIGDHTLIGMGAIVLNKAKIGKNCMVGAGALVTGGKEFPDGSLIIGSPAKVKRELTQAEIDSINENIEEYIHLAKVHAEL
ncbi:MAG: gamma carbonic anhydrase family protein [Dorea sp.]|nr:gamma carbonic anhydrase family protein [Dorea sp.]